MSAPARHRAGLPYVDPATQLRQFSWKGRENPARQVSVKALPLPEIARRYENAHICLSRRAITDAFQEMMVDSAVFLISSALRSRPTEICLSQLLGDLGSGFDIVSGGEIRAPWPHRYPGHRIVFSGVERPAKKSVKRCVIKANGVRPRILQFNVESVRNLKS